MGAYALIVPATRLDFNQWGFIISDEKWLSHFRILFYNPLFWNHSRSLGLHISPTFEDCRNSFVQAGCSPWWPTNSIKPLKGVRTSTEDLVNMSTTFILRVWRSATSNTLTYVHTLLCRSLSRFCSILTVHVYFAAAAPTATTTNTSGFLV